jgi:hypothetical protein
MNGQFSGSLHEKLVGKEQSYRWLKFGDFEGEQITVVAAQSEALSTNCFKEKILEEDIRSKCGLCKK